MEALKKKMGEDIQDAFLSTGKQSSVRPEGQTDGMVLAEKPVILDVSAFLASAAPADSPGMAAANRMLAAEPLTKAPAVLTVVAKSSGIV